MAGGWRVKRATPPKIQAKAWEKVYLYYAEPQGGNEDSLLVIMNYEFWILNSNTLSKLWNSEAMKQAPQVRETGAICIEKVYDIIEIFFFIC